MLWNRQSPGRPAPAPGERFRPARQVLATRAGEDTVLLDLRRGQYYTLNHVGARVWALLHDDCSAPDIVARLSTEYDAPAEVIAADVSALLATMAEASLVERAG